MLHVALRAPQGQQIEIDGVDVVPDVHEVLGRMAEFADRIRSGQWTGHTGKPILNIVNIGIGGCDLGPVMAYEALRHYSERDLTFRFVSNVDGTDFAEKTHDLDPAETLFIISSKTFTTLETMTNAAHRAGLGCSARWATRPPSPSISSRSPPTRTRSPKFGIDTDEHVRVLGLGGRPVFDGLRDRTVHDDRDRAGQLPRDAGRLPRHGRALPDRAVRANLPVLIGLLTFWYSDFFGAQTQAVLPYDQYLKRFPAYLQQLTMESNGKSVTLDGNRVDYEHRPGVLGRAGHERAALLLPADPPGHPTDPGRLHRLRALAEPARRSPRPADANVFAQGEALAFGKTAERGRGGGHARGAGAAQVFEGNRPSNTHADRAAHPARARHAGRAVRAQRVHPGHDLVDQLLRPVGRRAGQGAREEGHPDELRRR